MTDITPAAFTPPTIDEARERLSMPMVEAMRTQRAVRRLHTDPVDLDLIDELLELSLKAPTSSNSQDGCTSWLPTRLRRNGSDGCT